MSAPPDLHVIDKPPADGSEGPRVVVVHGAMDRAASFGRVGRQPAGPDVVRYDRRGYGESAALGTGTLDEHVEDLLGVLDGRPATVFGHSIGGVIALVAAQRGAGPGAVAARLRVPRAVGALVAARPKPPSRTRPGGRGRGVHAPGHRRPLLEPPARPHPRGAPRRGARAPG